jgi:hypothetical protein
MRLEPFDLMTDFERGYTAKYKLIADEGHDSSAIVALGRAMNFAFVDK